MHYTTRKLLYEEKKQCWNVGAYMRYRSLVYGVWYAYNFVVTEALRVMPPILTYMRKGLWRHGTLFYHL